MNINFTNFNIKNLVVSKICIIFANENNDGIVQLVERNRSSVHDDG